MEIIFKFLLNDAAELSDEMLLRIQMKDLCVRMLMTDGLVQIEYFLAEVNMESKETEKAHILLLWLVGLLQEEKYYVISL